MQGRRDGDDTPVEFLQPGRLEVAGPQSRLNMRNWHPAKEAGYRCGGCSRGISLDYHPVVLPAQQRMLNLPSHFTQLASEPRLLHHARASIERHGYVKKVEQARCQLQVLIGPEHVHRHRRFRRSAWQTGPSLIISGRAPNATSMRMGSAFLIASQS